MATEIEFNDNVLDVSPIIPVISSVDEPESIAANIQNLVDMLEGNNKNKAQEEKPKSPAEDDQKLLPSELTPTHNHKLNEGMELENDNELDQDREDVLEDDADDRKVDEFIA